MLADAFTGLGAMLMLAVGSDCAGLASSNPGLQKLVSGLIGFPCGLLIVLLTG